MISRIVHAACTCRGLFAIAEFMCSKETIMGNSGICYPKSPCDIFTPQCHTAAFFRYIIEEGDKSPSTKHLLAEIKKDRPQFSPLKETLCFFAPLIGERLKEFAVWRSLCTDTFATTGEHVFYTVFPQYSELSSLVVNYCMHFGCASQVHVVTALRKLLPQHDAVLTSLLSSFGKDAALCVVPQSEANPWPEVLNALCQTIVLTQEQIESLDIPSFKPHLDCPVPREVIDFAFVANVGCTPPLLFGSFRRWSGQFPKFSPGNGYAGSPHSLLGPKFKAEIVNEFKESNDRAAKLLGMGRLFPDPEPEPYWEPYGGLTPDEAHKIASHLDREFVKMLLPPFEKIEYQYQTRDQRMVHTALRESLEGQGMGSPRPHSTEPCKVSVLTLTHNHKNYIEACIKSVLEQQTSFPIEHIIADDGSDDGTQDIILEYAKHYPNIIPVFQKKRSYGAGNVQALFSTAKSPYVALCDGDDYFTDPDKLQTQADFLDVNPDCRLCFHPVRVLYEDAPEKERIYPPLDELPRGVRPFYYLSDLFTMNIIQTNSVMYRWRFRNGLPEWFRPDLMPGDWYWHLLHAELGKIGFINKIMSVYRRHRKSVYNAAEHNRIFHRYKVGRMELEVYKVINEHFKGKFKGTVYDLASGVFTDIMQFSISVNDFSEMDDLVEKYPKFASYFLAKLKKKQL